MRRSAAIAVMAIALAAGGCREADTDRAAAAVEELVAALERGDGSAACDRLSEAGVSELLLAAVQAEARPSGLDAATADRCALVAEELVSGAADLSRLREAEVTSAVVEGDRASISTTIGAYEAEEVEGRWRVARLEPVVRALTGAPPSTAAVHLRLVRPKLHAPALGPAVAGRVTSSPTELTGALDPPGADLRVEPAEGATATRVEARDGRFRVELELRPGPNLVVLSATAPGREPAELAVHLELDD